MNKGRLVLGFGLIVLSAVIFFVSSSAGWQMFDFEGGNDDESRISTTENLTDIHSIKAEGIVNVHISIGDTEQVKYVFNDQRFKNNSTFEDGILEIKFPSKNNGFKLFGASGSGADVYVTVKSLDHIQMNGVGSVRTTGVLQTDELKLINEGTGSMKIEVVAHKIESRNTGVGSLNISGTADSASLSNQGVGSLDADKLVVQVLDCENDGVGSMEVFAVQKIAMRNSGVGSLRYSGDAEVTSQRSEGVGSISKR